MNIEYTRTELELCKLGLHNIYGFAISQRKFFYPRNKGNLYPSKTGFCTPLQRCINHQSFPKFLIHVYIPRANSLHYKEGIELRGLIQLAWQYPDGLWVPSMGTEKLLMTLCSKNMRAGYSISEVVIKVDAVQIVFLYT